MENLNVQEYTKFTQYAEIGYIVFKVKSSLQYLKNERNDYLNFFSCSQMQQFVEI